MDSDVGHRINYQYLRHGICGVELLKLSPISPTGMVQSRARLWVRHRSAEGPTLRHRHANPIYFHLCDQAIGLTGFLVSGLERGCISIFATCVRRRDGLVQRHDALQRTLGSHSVLSPPISTFPWISWIPRFDHPAWRTPPRLKVFQGLSRDPSTAPRVRQTLGQRACS